MRRRLKSHLPIRIYSVPFAPILIAQIESKIGGNAADSAPALGSFGAISVRVVFDSMVYFKSWHLVVFCSLLAVLACLLGREILFARPVHVVFRGLAWKYPSVSSANLHVRRPMIEHEYETKRPR